MAFFPVNLEEHSELMKRWSGYAKWRHSLTPGAIVFPELPDGGVDGWRDVLHNTHQLYVHNAQISDPVLYTRAGARAVAAYLGLYWTGEQFALLPEPVAVARVTTALASLETEPIVTWSNEPDWGDSYVVTQFWGNHPWRHFHVDNMPARGHAGWVNTINSLRLDTTRPAWFPWHADEVRFRALILLNTPSGESYDPTEAYTLLDRYLKDASAFWLVGE